MKRFIKVFAVLLCLFVLTGCGGMSNPDRVKILDELKKQKVVYKDWTLLDEYIKTGSAQEWNFTDGYGYIYKDKNGDMYEIYIEPYKEQKLDNGDKQKVSNISKYKITGIDETLQPSKGSNPWYVFKSDSDKNINEENKDEESKKYERSKYIRDENTREDFTMTNSNAKFLFFKYKKYKLEKVNKKDA